jgi:hypothetical protein
MITKIYFGNS